MRRLVIIAVGAFAAHKLGLLFFDPAQGICGIWPASGVPVAALRLMPRRSWAAVLAVTSGTVLFSNLHAGIAPWLSLGFASANVVEGWIAAAVLHAISPARTSLVGIRETLALVFGAAVAVLVSGLIGASITSAAGFSPFAVEYRTWTIADFLGALVITPFAVDWCTDDREKAMRRGRWLELSAFALTWTAAAGLVFLRHRLPGNWNAHPYMLLPLLAWAALRFGRREVSTALVLLAVAAVIATARGDGAFGNMAGGPTERLVGAQLYLGITALSGLLLAAIQMERRSAELDAREQQARLEALGDNLPDGLVYQVVREHDGRMRFVYVSRGVERLHGVPVGAVLENADVLYDQLEPGDREEVQRAEQVSMQTLSPFRALVRSRNLKGELRTLLLSSSPRRLADGRILWDGVETDVTELRRAEEESRRAAERLRMALEAAGMGTWDWDIRSGQVFWSEQVQSIFGLRPGSFTGTFEAFLDLLHPDDRARVQQEAERALIGERDVFEAEYRVTGNDRVPRWLAATGRVYRSADGSAERMAGTVVDVTARKAAQETVRQSEERLRQAQKLESLGTLAGGIAHDFNNILGAIIARADLLRLSHQGDPEFDESIDQILVASHRAAGLVKQILSFSRQQGHQRTRTTMAAVVNEALAILRATLPSTIEIETRVDPALSPVFADPTQLHQVLINLCTNAAHAMNNRGTLGLRVERCSLPAGSALPRPDLPAGDYARLTVTDTGHGMDRATIDRIFDPFFTTKGPGGGTGLGLAVVFGIVKDHDGAITVQSEPGKGSTFSVYLPLATAEVALAQPSPHPESSGHGELVLFVDDEAVLCDVARELLARAGYRVEICRTSREAWATLEKDWHRFAAVVTDLTMPGMTGLELAARIAKLAHPPPVIVTSGFLDSEATEALARLDVHRVIQKPYDFEQLSSAVASAVASRLPSTQSQSA